MNSTGYATKLATSPISGRTVCETLVHAFNLSDICEIRDIETLCAHDCAELGNLWQAVSNGHGARCSVEELVAALMHADQVIALDLQWVGDRSRELVIEDGELVTNHL